MKRVLYPGSFDPITKGHMSVIEEASLIFDEVVIGILINSSKKESFFKADEREKMIKLLYKGYDNIRVLYSEKTAVDVALENDCVAILRGLRGLNDFDYEIALSQINKEISENRISTVCLFSNPNFHHISSSVVKELFNYNKNVSRYIDPFIEKQMKLKRGII